MEKNVAGIWIVYAFGDSGHANPGDPVTGLSDISAELRQDGGAADALTDALAAELQDGYYYFDISAAENNFENLVLCPSEGTVANVTVVAIPAATWTRPPNLSDMVISATGITDANIEQINNVASAAEKLAASADTIVLGTVSGTPTDIQFESDLVSTENDNPNGKVLTWRSDTTTAALRGQAQFISSYDGLTKIITVGGPFTATPVAGDTFVIA